MQALVCSSDLRWMRALKAVAWFFIVTGIFGILATIWSAVFYDRLVLDFGNLLNLFPDTACSISAGAGGFICWSIYG